MRTSINNNYKLDMNEYMVDNKTFDKLIETKKVAIRVPFSNQIQPNYSLNICCCDGLSKICNIDSIYRFEDNDDGLFSMLLAELHGYFPSGCVLHKKNSPSFLLLLSLRKRTRSPSEDLIIGR